jgi:hypothetical protein
MLKSPGKLRFVLASRGGDQGTQAALVDNDQAMLIKPAPRETQEPLPVIGTHELLAQGAHQRAPLIARRSVMYAVRISAR